MDAWTTLYGFFLQAEFFQLSVVIFAFIGLVLGYNGAPLWLWTLCGAAVVVGYHAPMELMVPLAVLAVIFNLKPLRTLVASLPVMKLFQALKLMPKISPTERTALEAGVVWMEAELFSGRPNFKTMLSQPVATLSKAEQAFLDGETRRSVK